MRRLFVWVRSAFVGAVASGGACFAQQIPPTGAVRAAPPTPAPTDVIVTGRRLVKPCGERDNTCILEVAKEVWTHYPQQIQTFCQSERTQKGMERMLVEQLGLTSAYDSQSASEVSDTLPGPLAMVCNYKGERTHQIAGNWAPWAAVPSDADLAAAYPRSAKVNSGDARINCKVEDNGHLEDCHLSDEAPDRQGFGKAAMNLSRRFHVLPMLARQKRDTPFWVDVAVHFVRGGEASRVITAPDWTILPDPAQTADLYPANAAKAGASTGVGKVDCRIGEDGKLGDCALVSEEPPALGFGAAALSAAAQMHANLWTRDGARAIGARVVVPLRFDAPQVDASKADVQKSSSGG